MRLGASRLGGPMVRDFGAKLRITAAALGCASQKDLCARFREVNPGRPSNSTARTSGRRGAPCRAPVGPHRGLGGAARHGAAGRPGSPGVHRPDEFLELVGAAGSEAEPRGLVAGGGASSTSRRSRCPAAPGAAKMPCPARHLVGVYACYSHAWSPYFEGRASRARLAIEAAADARPAVLATYGRGAGAPSDGSRRADRWPCGPVGPWSTSPTPREFPARP